MRQSMIYVCILLCVAGGSAGCSRNEPALPNFKSPETQEQDAWVDAEKQPARLGDAVVRVTRVRYGEPLLRGLKSDEKPPDGKKVIVYLEIKNLSETKKMPHLSWARSDGAFRARLRDPQGTAGSVNHAFTYCGEVDGVKTTDGSIPPGQTAKDLVAFEFSIEKVKTLQLTLPAVHIGQKDNVRFKIPVTMIERN